MTGVFLQARMDSSRLPGKALLPLGDSTLVGEAMRSLRTVGADFHVLLTDPDSESRLSPEAEKAGFLVHTGSKENVLARFCSAIRRFGVKTLIRATGDNPLVSARMAERALMELNRRKVDYFAYDGLPLGCGVETVRSEALLTAEKEAVNAYQTEHVCPFLYQNPERFRILRILAPENLQCPKARVTVDRHEDYDLVVQIYQELYDKKPVEIEELIPWLEQHSKRLSLSLP